MQLPGSLKRLEDYSVKGINGGKQT